LKPEILNWKSQLPAVQRIARWWLFWFLLFAQLQSFGQTRQIDSLKNELTISREQKRVSLLLSLSQQFLKHNLDTSAAYAFRALTLAEQNNNVNELARVYSQLGRTKLVSGPFEDALDYLLKSESFFLQENPVDRQELLRVYANLGSVYERLDELDKSQRYFESAIQMLDQLDQETATKTPSPLHAPLYNNFANTLIKKGDTAKAIIYQKKGLEYAMNAKDYFQASSLLNNLGKLHLERNEPDLGYPYLKQGATLRKLVNDDRGLSASYRNLAFYFLKVNILDSAKFYIRQSIQLYHQIGDMNEPLSGVYMVLSDIYHAEKQFDSALYAYKVHITYRDSLYGGPKFKELARVEAKYEMLKKAQQEQALQKAKELRTIITISALMIGLLTISLLLLFQRLRSKNQRLQFEQLKLREEKLVIDLEYKRKDLATQMLFLLKKDEFIHKISQRIMGVKEEVPADIQPKLLKITKELQNISKSNDSSWREFELRFKEVHQDFYEKLAVQYPDLTPKERRLCALLKLNMTTKEISAITHQSTRSLEVARTRLRRKFNLTNSEIGLVDFLAKI
jgi:tetratricopeptide (TPR) repeat protein